MADQEEEDLKMVLRLSLKDQNFGVEEKCTSPEVNNRVAQQNLSTAAGEKRMAAAKSVENTTDVDNKGLDEGSKDKGMSEMELPVLEANKLFLLIFGKGVGKNVLAQWTNQGIRFSDDPETSMGLVQHEAGPCGVLAALQAFVLKYLIFCPDEPDDIVSNTSPSLAVTGAFKNESLWADIFLTISEETKSRALVRSMCDILFLCGSNETASIAYLDIPDGDSAEFTSGSKDEVVAKLLEGISVESGSDLQKVLRIHTCTSRSILVQKLEGLLPIFRSRMGAFLFLVSALLSRGLDNVREDMDDPSQSLVAAPFGHASQEIVNLLISGRAVANVFDGEMDVDGGMFVKGISSAVEVGFLTLLESLNFCKVGQHLKRPKWPIWVVGSETHYSVLFALDNKVQDDNELEQREASIRTAFDGQDQSGGGGFISVEGFHQVVNETGVNFPAEKIELLCSSGFVLWSEFWQAVLDSGGMKEKVFEVYHFNGIAKSVGNGSEVRVQKPRLSRLRLKVPSSFEGDLGLGDLSITDNSSLQESGAEAAQNNSTWDNSSWQESGAEAAQNNSTWDNWDNLSWQESGTEAAQNGPLVDCIRTRWPRAVCSWEGDAPSIV